MHSLIGLLLLALFVSNGQFALATPLSDAMFIAQRNVEKLSDTSIEKHLKEQLVQVHARPLLAEGIKINDAGRFAELIREEDIAPLKELYLSDIVERYVLTFTPEQLSVIASLMRENDTISFGQILSKDFAQQQAAALKQARASATPSGLDDPLILQAEQMVRKLNVLNELLQNERGGFMMEGIALAMSSAIGAMRVGREIDGLQRGIDHPVTIAALKADGVLGFANLVQRQSLLRKFAAPTRTGGVSFQRPPSKAGSLD